MKPVWVAAALAPLSLAATAGAQVTISNSTSTPVSTQSAGGDVTIASGGSINLKTGGTATAPIAAATQNTANNVTNSGTIQSSGVDNIIGIQGTGGFTTATDNIDNESAIQLNETVNQKINNKNGIAEGPFASGTNRIGIDIVGSSPLNGSVTNNGSITIIGESSGGILIGAGGINGALADGGSITVTGDNGFGIHSQGLVGGAVTVGGAISVTGMNATGLALDQGATGKLDITDSITVTGFHSSTAPVTANQIKSLDPTQIEPAGPAVSIGGGVGGGISIDAATAAVAATGTTAAVAATNGGVITASGGMGLVIGGANPITIGAGTNGASLFIGGSVSSNGVYRNFGATGVQIGGTGGAAVNLPGGIDITGSVGATTVATATSATDGAGNTIVPDAIALHLMSGVSTGNITIGAPLTIGGSLTASSTSTVANNVTALMIDAGAAPTNATLTNYGTISASITGIAAVIGGAPAAGGTQGVATAILDKAGVIGAINNYGAISATITPIVSTDVSTGSTVALDLRGNTAGVTITQDQASVIPATSSTSATTPVAPSITGDVLFGSGNAALNLYAGTLTGAVAFESATGNSLDIENGATVTGAVSEASGGELALSVGTNANNTVTSTLDMTATSLKAPNVIGLSSLNIGKSGQVIFTVDPNNSASYQFAVTGNATLAAGAKIGVNIISADPNVQTFNLITTTGTLTSAQPASALLGTSTFLFNTTLNETTGADGSVSVTISPKTAAQLGLNPAETAAYTAIFDQLKSDQDAAVTADVLSKTNRPDFIHIYDQFLPDYEGGVFDTLVAGQGQIAQAEADTPVKLQTDEPHGWVEEIGYLADRQDTSSANGYRASGFGFIGGIEQSHGDSAVGVAAAFVTDGVVDDRQSASGVVATAGVEAGVYWREGDPHDGLAMHASLNGGYLSLSNHRLLYDATYSGTVNLYRLAKSQWNGATASAEFGASYQIPIGRFYIRPEVIADYVYLYESGFSEHGGGPSEDLAVASRSSAEGSAVGDIVIGEDLGGVYHWRPEMTLGWRQVFSGGPGDTTARFISGGPSFTLSPKFDDKGSLVARFGVRAGGQYADFSADAGGQLNNTYQVYNARAVARFLF